MSRPDMDEIWSARRKKLEEAAKVSSLALLDHMNGAAAARIPVPGRTDATHLVIALEKR